MVPIVPRFDRDTPRFAKAVALHAAGRVARRGDVWVVASQQHRNVRYTVRHTLGTSWRCSCPDFDLHDAPCKHMMATFLAIEAEINAANAAIEAAGDDDDDLPPGPGLTVDALRKALVGVPGHLSVTVRATGDGDATCGGIVAAAMEENCGGLHFAIDFSDAPEDFDAEKG